MEVVILLVVLFIIYLLICLYDKYKPYLDFIVTSDGYTLLLWYSDEVTNERTYIKILEL